VKEDDVVEILRDFISKKFPKDCPVCKKRYNSLAEYLRNTTHVGKPVSYDADQKDWMPEKPLGTLSMANCSCGNTLVIESSGMGLITMWRLLNWVRTETRARGITTSELLEDLRNEIDKSVLQDENNTI